MKHCVLVRGRQPLGDGPYGTLVDAAAAGVAQRLEYRPNLRARAEHMLRGSDYREASNPRRDRSLPWGTATALAGRLEQG